MISPMAARINAANNRTQLSDMTDNGKVDKRVFISQSDYDALATKDAKTEYVIMPPEYFV